MSWLQVLFYRTELLQRRFEVGDEVTGAWEVHVHDADDGASVFSTPKLPEALGKLQEVLASAPFHLNELEGLGFRLT